MLDSLKSGASRVEAKPVQSLENLNYAEMNLKDMSKMFERNAAKREVPKPYERDATKWSDKNGARLGERDAPKLWDRDAPKTYERDASRLWDRDDLRIQDTTKFSEKHNLKMNDYRSKFVSSSR